jgi:hypothetical protein
MAARTTQLALLVDQFVPALWTKPPVLAGGVSIRRHGLVIHSGFLKFSRAGYNRLYILNNVNMLNVWLV